MDNPVKSLTPYVLWNYFYQITQVPHPSFQMENIKAFLFEFARYFQLEIQTDDTGNILIRKSATKGKEHLPIIILQAHLDMVPQKEEGSTFMFEFEGLHLIKEKEIVRADQTTLGADNGIGVAAILAVLSSSNLEHPSLEALFTIDEEVGMIGAFGLKKDFLKGEILLNLDSEEDGKLFISCAGATTVEGHFSFVSEHSNPECHFFKIEITGLLGGHSGVDIHLERANANKLLARFLRSVENLGVRLSDISGGTLFNAIPRNAQAAISVHPSMVDKLEKEIENFRQTIFSEYQFKDPDIDIKLCSAENQEWWVPKDLQSRIVSVLLVCPDGVCGHLETMPDVVETSNNLALIKIDRNIVRITCLARSVIESRKKVLVEEIKSLYSLAQGETVISGDYCGWEPDINSDLLHKSAEIFEKQRGYKPEIKAMHAGLECGIIHSVYPDMKMISFGPTIRYPHSPKEYVEIKSVNNFWMFLTTLLAEIE